MAGSTSHSELACGKLGTAASLAYLQQGDRAACRLRSEVTRPAACKSNLSSKIKVCHQGCQLAECSGQDF